MLRAARNPARFRFIGIVFFAVLAACGSGGSSGGGSGGTLPVVPTTPTPTFSVSGTLTDGTSALSGATVTIGSLPASTCAGWAGCGSPLAPTLTATTDSGGAFTVSNLVNGSYMLTISKDANPTSAQTYAILHRQIPIAGANLALGSVKIVQLSADERAWIAQLNSDRANVSVPATAPIVVDEYAQEQARQWAIDVDAGTAPATDPGFAPYEAAYGAKPGSMYPVTHVGDINTTWQAALDSSPTSWYAEKSNCPGGNWQTCPQGGTTQHYINLSNSGDIWIGLGEDLAGVYQGGPFHAFDGIIVYK
jgi:hypothetical protein